MKTCPQCRAHCADDTVVCASCGYLFSASGAGYGGTFGTPDTQPPRDSQPWQAPPQPQRRPGAETGAPALVLGLISIVLASCGIGLITGVIGLVIGALSLRRAKAAGRPAPGYARAGMVLCVLAILYAGLAIAYSVYIVTHLSQFPEYQSLYNQIYSALEQSASS